LICGEHIPVRNFAMVVNDIGYAGVDDAGAIAPTLRGDGIRRQFGDPCIPVLYPVRRHYIWCLSKPVQLECLSDQMSSNLMPIKRLSPEPADLDGSS
jgi:hypothetical protein